MVFPFNNIKLYLSKHKKEQINKLNEYRRSYDMKIHSIEIINYS